MTKVNVTYDALKVAAQALMDAFELKHSIDFAPLTQMEIDKVINDLIQLVLKKNADYGDSWQRYGMFTGLIRLNDKLLRVQTLADGRQAMVADEGIGDTLVDIVGYGLLLKVWQDGQGQEEDINAAAMHTHEVNGHVYTEEEYKGLYSTSPVEQLIRSGAIPLPLPTFKWDNEMSRAIEESTTADVGMIAQLPEDIQSAKVDWYNWVSEGIHQAVSAFGLSKEQLEGAVTKANETGKPVLVAQQLPLPSEMLPRMCREEERLKAIASNTPCSEHDNKIYEDMLVLDDRYNGGLFIYDERPYLSSKINWRTDYSTTPSRHFIYETDLDIKWEPDNDPNTASDVA